MRIFGILMKASTRSPCGASVPELWLPLHPSVSAPPGAIAAYLVTRQRCLVIHDFPNFGRHRLTLVAAQGHRPDCPVGLCGAATVGCGLRRGFPSPVYPSMCVCDVTSPARGCYKQHPSLARRRRVSPEGQFVAAGPASAVASCEA